MEYTEVIEMIDKFRDARGWEKYHNLKDLAISVNLEASEILEIFQWKNEQGSLSEEDKIKLKEEIADTLIYLFYMVDKLEMNPYEEIQKKVEINKKRHWKQDK
ncbi:nucleotide pyrophosphohydrolase [Ligilactobacillus salivarius]|uniref:nucleotide pyrophosphohydrolase n=1 Tax=Ligilactobacillus salivarius TaxID=1624 RepID=UPI0011CB98FA|nr:nucleotide pyrophosphohydrolase [Ligilactobacillus salivarius]MDE7523038.1 nucleotide pyrophosphohydrolase [Ligilactobacillus salivarius]TXJ75845.1 nucleotide pyrophosphohydrolase [Ligilactobacillus salivarius]